MQAIMETLFDIFYLTTVISMGIIMIRKSQKGTVTRLFGIMAIILGSGDAFHLVPRAYSLMTIGLENNLVALGIGKLITSITMTIFYLILYYVLRKRFKIEGHQKTTYTLIVLAVIRVVLCFMPQNMWTSVDAPFVWGIYRNIPFLIMGIIMIVMSYRYAKRDDDKIFKNLWLAILLSFGFYAAVVLGAGTYTLLGMLMIPKTIMYVWIVKMGYNTLKEN